MILIKTPEQILEERVEALEKHLKAIETYAFALDNRLRKVELIGVEQGVEIKKLKTEIKVLGKQVEYLIREAESQEEEK